MSGQNTKSTKLLKWLGTSIATYILDKLVSPIATGLYSLGSLVVLYLLAILSTDRLKVALLTQAGSVNLEPFLSIAMIILPLLALFFFFGYKYVVWFHITRKYKFFKVDGFAWKFIVDSDTIENHAYCIKHKLQLIYSTSTNCFCPKCNAPKDLSPLSQQYQLSRAKAASLAMKWKYKY